MFTSTLQQLGLAKNEAEVYEALLRWGEMTTGMIAIKSGVHRRNVYDCLQRLLEKGLVFELIESRESRYQPAAPHKLKELIEEKEQVLDRILPDLEKIHGTAAKSSGVFVYRGIEGWKNYMRDILRVGKDFYCIGGKGGWMDNRVMHFFPHFIKEAKRKKITFYHLFDHKVKDSGHDIVTHVGKNYKFLPKGYSAPASVDFFGDYVNIISDIHLGGVAQNMTFTVINNEQIADAFRIWFKFMWDYCPDR